MQSSAQPVIKHWPSAFEVVRDAAKIEKFFRSLRRFFAKRLVCSWEGTPWTRNDLVAMLVLCTQVNPFSEFVWAAILLVDGLKISLGFPGPFKHSYA